MAVVGLDSRTSRAGGVPHEKRRRPFGGCSDCWDDDGLKIYMFNDKMQRKEKELSKRHNENICACKTNL